MNVLMKKLIAGSQITVKDIEYELYEICDREHASCSDACPVYEKNNGIPYNSQHTNCFCFKDGKSMLEFLRG